MKRGNGLRRKTALARKALHRERDTIVNLAPVDVEPYRPGARARTNGIGVPRRAVSPASSLQRAKAREGCRVHGAACGGADPAHVIDRSLGGCNDELCVVPLCRELHRAYDEHRFDLLPYLSYAEQAHAVGHVGLLRALRRIGGPNAMPFGPDTRY